MENNSAPVTLITAGTESLGIYFKKLWQYRALIVVFARRDLEVKYAQTWLGLGWTIVQPLTGLLIFTFFFGYVLKWDSEGVPYSLYVLSGLLGWNFFNYVTIQGMGSIQESGHILRKIYFPKAILPLSKVVVAIVELLISFVLLVPLMLWHEQALSWRCIFIPFVLLFNTLIPLFLVFTVASLSYRLRDLFHIVPFLLYFGMWVTPVFFTKSTFPGAIDMIWYFNPMASVVEAWRWCLFPGLKFDFYFLPALLIILPLFIAGIYGYSKSERNFSDYA